MNHTITMINMSDLVLEIASENNSGAEVAKTVWSDSGTKCSHYNILPGSMSEICGRAAGEYFAFEGDTSSMSKVIGKEMRAKIAENNTILVVGLGNPQFIADRLGESVLDKLKLKPNVSKLYPLCESLTNIPSFKLIKAAVAFMKPSLVIAIDTLSSLKVERLGKSFQLTTAGVSPGSGVNNTQPRLSQETIGVPILAIGVPLVSSIKSSQDGKIVATYITLAEIDKVVESSAKIIADSINLAIN